MPAPVVTGPKKAKHADTSNDKKSTKPADAPIINEEADRILGRMTLQTMGVLFLAVIAMTVLGALTSEQHSRAYAYHRPIAFFTSLFMLVVFYWMNGRVYAKRLEIGRELAAKREYKQVIACLNPFDALGGRSLDGTGEAHYLLAQAYAGTGNKARGEKCRQFVLKYRKGPWAVKLGGKPASTGTGPPTSTAEAAKPKPPRSKPKRRF